MAAAASCRRLLKASILSHRAISVWCEPIPWLENATNTLPSSPKEPGTQGQVGMATGAHPAGATEGLGAVRGAGVGLGCDLQNVLPLKEEKIWGLLQGWKYGWMWSLEQPLCPPRAPLDKVCSEHPQSLHPPAHLLHESPLPAPAPR